MSSHFREGKGAAVATPAGVFAGCAEKDVALALEFGRGEPLGVQLDLAEGEWLDAAVEELDAGGIWRTFKTEMTDECRIRRFGGEFRPGISRIFRLRRE